MNLSKENLLEHQVRLKLFIKTFLSDLRANRHQSKRRSIFWCYEVCNKTITTWKGNRNCTIRHTPIDISIRVFTNFNTFSPKKRLAKCSNNVYGCKRTATTHIKRQLISSDNSYQATTNINLKKRQLISSDNLYQSKLISEKFIRNNP